MWKWLSAMIGLGVIAGIGSEFYTYAAEDYWTPHVIYSGPCCTDGTRLADLDSDGRIDIVTSIEESGSVAILLKEEGQRWSSIFLARRDLIKRPEDVLPAHIDSDGFVDLLISQENKSQKHTVCFNPGSDAREPYKWRCEIVPATHGMRSWIVAEQMTLADGRKAFVVGGKESDNKGPGSIGLLVPSSNVHDLRGWKVRTLMNTAKWVMAIVIKDVNRDGRVDIVYVDRMEPGAGVHWLEQPQEVDGNWIDHPVSLDVSGAMFAVAHGETIFALERSDRWRIVEYDLLSAKIISRIDLPSRQCTPRSFGVGNFNLVANDEFAVMCSDTRFLRTRAYVLTGEGDDWIFTPIARAPYTRFVQTKYDSVTPIDMDGDGDLDLLTDEETSGGNGQGVLWYENPALNRPLRAQ